LEFIALEGTVLRLSLKLDIVERLGLDVSGSLVDDTVLCKDLLLDVMLFRLGELSLFKLEETGLRKEEDCCSLNMDMELRGAMTETPALKWWLLLHWAKPIPKAGARQTA